MGRNFNGYVYMYMKIHVHEALDEATCTAWWFTFTHISHINFEYNVAISSSKCVYTVCSAEDNNQINMEMFLMYCQK